MGYKPTKDIETTEIGGITRGLKKLFGKGDPVKQRRKAVERVERENVGKLLNVNAQKESNLLTSNTVSDTLSRNRQTLFGNLSTNVLAAKNGVKIFHQKRGKQEHNVIPDGALHARRHNLPEDISEQVTDKGIPVITYDKEGGVTQHAEIEKNEIIFHKQVTEKLEELLNKYNEGDESAAIDAGKLLTYEILENTIDNTGLLNNVN